MSTPFIKRLPVSAVFVVSLGVVGLLLSMFVVFASSANAAFSGANGRIIFTGSEKAVGTQLSLQQYINCSVSVSDVGGLCPNGQPFQALTSSRDGSNKAFGDISPDGTLLVFRATDPDTFTRHLFVGSVQQALADPLVRADTQQITFGNTTYDSYPRWTRDGKYLVFMSGTLDPPAHPVVPNVTNLFMMEKSTGNVVQLTDTPGSSSALPKLPAGYLSASAPRPSNDGKSILFTIQDNFDSAKDNPNNLKNPENLKSAVAILKLGFDRRGNLVPANGVITQLTADSLIGGGADISPDGKQFTFANNNCASKCLNGDEYLANIADAPISSLGNSLGSGKAKKITPAGININNTNVSGTAISPNGKIALMEGATNCPPSTGQDSASCKKTLSQMFLLVSQNGLPNQATSLSGPLAAPGPNSFFGNWLVAS